MVVGRPALVLLLLSLLVGCQWLDTSRIPCAEDAHCPDDQVCDAGEGLCVVGGGSAGDDGAAPPNGLFYFYEMYDFPDLWGAGLLLDEDTAADCADLITGTYHYSEDPSEHVWSFVYRSGSLPWEGVYAPYYFPLCDLQSNSVQCFNGVWRLDGGAYHEPTPDDTMTIAEFTSASLSGSITLDGTTFEMNLTNCGSVEDWGDGDDDDSARDDPRESVEDPSGGEGGAGWRGSWQLRFR